MSSLKLDRINSINGEITLIGSKSMSNRVMLLAGVAEGTTVIRNVLFSEDTRYMMEALEKLGVSIDFEGDAFVVDGLGHAFDLPHTQGQPLELLLGNAGTVMRPLTAMLAVSSGQFLLTGSERMLERPIGPLVEGLHQLGLQVDYLNFEGYPPLLITGGTPQGDTVHVPGHISSQFITALVMMAPMLENALEIVVDGELISKPYVDLTLATMERFGAKVTRQGHERFFVQPGGYTSPGTFLVEGDATAATYFMAAAAVGGYVKINGLGRNSVQGDIGFVEVLQRMGARINVADDYIEVFKSELSGIDIDMNDMPDAAMTLAPLALFTSSPVAIRNIASWRIKETDRLEAMVMELMKLDVSINYGYDFIEIDASQRNDAPVEFDTYTDHRMAMSLALVALDRDVVINNPEVTHKTFPRYFEMLRSISL